MQLTNIVQNNVQNTLEGNISVFTRHENRKYVSLSETNCFLIF